MQKVSLKIILLMMDFAQLKTPLSVAATDIKKGKAIYFSEGELD